MIVESANHVRLVITFQPQSNIWMWMRSHNFHLRCQSVFRSPITTFHSHLLNIYRFFTFNTFQVHTQYNGRMGERNYFLSRYENKKILMWNNWQIIKTSPYTPLLVPSLYPAVSVPLSLYKVLALSLNQVLFIIPTLTW